MRLILFQCLLILASVGSIRGEEAATPLRPQLVIQNGVTSSVRAAISGDGKVVVMGTADRRYIVNGDPENFIQFWSLQTGLLLREILDIGPFLAIAPDGRTIAVGKDSGAVGLVDCLSGKELTRLPSSGISATCARFSRDGQLLVIGATGGHITLFNIQQRKAIQTFSIKNASIAAEGVMAINAPLIVNAVDISPNSETVISAGNDIPSTGNDAVVRVWDVSSGREVKQFECHRPAGDNKSVGQSIMMTTCFSYDGKMIAAGNSDGSVRVWNTSSGNELLSLDMARHSRISSVEFSHKGNRLAVGTWDNSHVQIYDISSKKLTMTLENAYPTASVEFSSDDDALLVGDYQFDVRGRLLRYFYSPEPPSAVVGASLFSLGDKASITKPKSLRSQTRGLQYVGFSGDGKLAFIGSPQQRRGDKLDEPRLQCWDLTSGVRRWDLQCPNPVEKVIVAPGSSSAIVLYDLGVPVGLNINTGTQLLKEPFEIDIPWNDVRSAEFGNQMDIALLLTSQMAVKQKTESTGAFLAKQGRTQRINSENPIEGCAISKDGSLIAAMTKNYISVLDTGSVSEISRITDLGTVRRGDVVMQGNTWIELDGRTKSVLVSRLDQTVRLYDANTGKERWRIADRKADPWKALFSSDSKWIAIAYRDGYVRVVDTQGGRELSHLLRDRTELMDIDISPTRDIIVTNSRNNSTQFWDAISGSEICRLASPTENDWIVVDPSGHFDTNNLDKPTGMRWTMPNDPFNSLPIETFMRDYYEPKLLARILSGEKFDPVKDLQNLNRVQPSVKIVKVEPQPDQSDEVAVRIEVADESREYERNGKTEIVHSGVFDVRLFRDGQLVGYRPKEDGAVTLVDGKAVLFFEHIKLPRKPEVKDVEFSAYAFNSDRVKSETDIFTYCLPAPLALRSGAAYIICFGASAFENASWDLGYASNDAKDTAEKLAGILGQNKQFSRVVSVPLISEAQKRDGERVINVNRATKANLQAVLAVLAGGTGDANLLRQIPGASELQKALPEDLVLLSFSTHGYNGENGQYYLLPADTGRGLERHVDELLKKRMISTDELSQWLRDIDAGEMVMIVDACQSAASVEQEGFKPGPMGSRGLGQLAYDKRMHILAASRAAENAIEDEGIGHGLLTYALLHDGLDCLQADFDPADGQISIGEWLRYGVKRVPLLANDVLTGQLRLVTPPVKGAAPLRLNTHETSQSVQQPVLFDFTKGRTSVLWVK